MIRSVDVTSCEILQHILLRWQQHQNIHTYHTKTVPADTTQTILLTDVLLLLLLLYFDSQIQHTLNVLYLCLTMYTFVPVHTMKA